MDSFLCKDLIEKEDNFGGKSDIIRYEVWDGGEYKNIKIPD